jgi:uncharacterized protein (TIGR02996 family)
VIPDDDETRLVMADELSERCSPRGEFILCQVFLAAGGLDAPDAPELIRRQDELLARHGLHWSRVFGDGVHGCRFHRGFVDDIAIDDELELRPSLFERESVRAVRVNSVGNGRAFAMNPLLARVRSLSLERCLDPHPVLESRYVAPESLMVERFVRLPSPLPSVRRLVHAQFFNPSFIESFPNLRELDTTWRTPLPASLAARLESLDVRNVIPNEIEQIFAAPGLRPRRLGFHHGRGDLIIRLLAAWPGLAGLDELALRGVELRDLSPLFDTPLRPRRLDVAGNWINDEAFTALLRSPIMERVVHLGIGPRMSYEPFTRAKLERLVVIDMDGADLSGARSFIDRLSRLPLSLPRLARVAYSRARRGPDASWMAPL